MTVPESCNILVSQVPGSWETLNVKDTTLGKNDQEGKIWVRAGLRVPYLRPWVNNREAFAKGAGSSSFNSFEDPGRHQQGGAYSLDMFSSSTVSLPSASCKCDQSITHLVALDLASGSTFSSHET